MEEEQKYEFLAEDPSVNVKPIVISMTIGAFFAILNETLLNIALTTLMKEFELSLATAQWMATGFMLVMGIVIPVSALLLQWFTTRQMFLGTMIIFTLGTILCALAPTFPVLIVGRLIQAVGTGLLMPIIFNTFLLIYPPYRRGAIMGIIGLVIMFAPAIGPTLSGVIVEYLGWRYLFIIVIPFAIFSILFGYKHLRNVSEVTKPKVDILSIIFSTSGFGGLVYSFSAVGDAPEGFSAMGVYIPLIAGIVGLILFIFRQLRLEEPLMDLRVFRYPMFTLGVIMFVLIIMMMFASEIILPLFMQGPLMLAASTAGLLLLPGSVMNGLLSPVTGKLFDKYGPRVLMIPATIALVGVMFAFRYLNADTSNGYIITGYIILMIAISAIMMPSETNGLNQLPKSLYPHGTAVMTTLQPVAGAIGVSVFIGLMNTKQQSFLDQLSGPITAQAESNAMVAGVEFVYSVAFLLALGAFVVALFVKRAEPN